MFPHGRSLTKKLAGKPFAIIGVNSDLDPSIPQQLFNNGEVTWRSFYEGPDRPISETWKAFTLPTIFLVDAKGTIRFINPQTVDGRIHLPNLDDAIETLLAEMGHTVDLGDHDESEEAVDGAESEGDAAD